MGQYEKVNDKTESDCLERSKKQGRTSALNYILVNFIVWPFSLISQKIRRIYRNVLFGSPAGYITIMLWYIAS